MTSIAPKTSCIPLVLASFAAACGPSEEGVTLPEAVELHQAALGSGDPYFPPNSGCSATAQQALLNATRRARKILVDEAPLLKGCLSEAYMSGPNTRYPANFPYTSGSASRGTGWPEWMIYKLKEGVPLTYTCTNQGTNVAANANLRVGSEAIEWNLHPEAFAFSRLVETVLHELAHNKGFDHFDGTELQNGAAYVVGDCARKIVDGSTDPLSGSLRRQLFAETTLARVGMERGDGFDSSCPATDVAVGIHGRAQGSQIALGLTCGQGTVGSTTTDQASCCGDTSLPTYRRSCKADEVMVGMRGLANETITSFAPVCAPRSWVAAKDPRRFPLPTIGGQGAVPWDRQCPLGMAVKAVHALYDGAIPSLEIVCQDIAKAQPIALLHPSAQVGTTEGELVTDYCPGRTVLTSIRGGFVVTSTATLLQRLGGHCSQMVTSGGVTQWWAAGPVKLAGRGPSAPTNLDQQCPDGQFPVGIRLAVGADWQGGTDIATIGAVCAPPAAWQDTAQNPALTRLAPMLATTLPLTEQICGRGEFIAGWTMSSNDEVNSLRIVCRKFTADTGIPSGNTLLKPPAAKLLSVAADFTGDRYPDLLGRKPDGTMWLWRGDGTGGFANPSGTQLPGGGWQMFDRIWWASDFSGDGKGDLMGRTPAGLLYLYRGNGTEGWITGVGENIGWGWQGFTSIFVPGDFNGDGRADVLAHSSNGYLYRYDGNGASGWVTGLGVEIPSGSFAEYQQLVSPGDVTGDFLPDIVMRKTVDGTTWRTASSGVGGFDMHLPLLTQLIVPLSPYNLVIAVGDFSGDGNPDLMGRKPDGTLWLHKGDGAGGIGFGTQLPGSSWNNFDALVGAW